MIASGKKFSVAELEELPGVGPYTARAVAAFANVLRGLRPGAPLVVVAHDRHGLYPGIAAALGVTVEGTVERMVGRRTGRRAGVLTETIFVWRKP